MAKVVFVTFYDQYSIGLRVMSSLLRQAHHEAQIIYFKLPYIGVIDMPNENPVSGEIFVNWQLKEYAKSENPWTLKEEKILISELKRVDPDVIGISNRSPLDKPSIPILKKIKEYFSKKLLIAGGYGPFFNPELYLKYVDYVVFGEGEDVIVDIVNLYKNKLLIKNLANIIYRENQYIKYTKIINPETNLDKYPIPSYDDSFNHCYIEDNNLYNYDPVTIFNPNIDTYPLLIGRGCIRHCSYCSAGQWNRLYKQYGKINIKPQRVRSVSHIMHELEQAKEKGYKYISILESHLTGSKSYLLSFFNTYKEKINLPFTAYLHPDQIVNNPEILEAACNAGLKKCPIGIQHGCQEICEEYFNRFLSNEIILKFAQMLDEKKIISEYQIIAGLPFETKETLIKSFDFVKLLPNKYSYLIISRLKCFPKSPLEKLFIDRKIDTKINMKEWYFIALLYLLRIILDDDIFIEIQNIIFQSFQESKSFLLSDIENFYKNLALILRKKKKTIIDDKNLLLRLYKGYIDIFKQDITLIIDNSFTNEYCNIIPSNRVKNIVIAKDTKSNELLNKFSSSKLIEVRDIHICNNELIIIICENKEKIISQIKHLVNDNVIIP